MASSIGSRDSVSFLLTIQATGLLTFTLVGLPPTEYASLRWTHPHALRIPPRDGPPALRKTARIGSRSALAVSRFRLRARLGFSIPLPLSGPRGITPAFGYGAPHPSARGTSTPLNNALLSAHYGPGRHRLAFDRFPGFAGYTTYLAPPISRWGEDGFSSCSTCPCHRAVPTTPPK